MSNHFDFESSDTSSTSDDSDASSDESIFELCLLSLNLASREAKYHRLRISWDNHATMLIHEKQFDSKYRMSYESFMHLVTLLEPNLRQDDRKSMNSCGQLAICPPHILGLTIRWLSGSSFHDIRDAGNFSRPSFFRLLRKGLRAILTCKELQITLPNTQDELDEVLEGFKSKSTEEVMSGCVGALDGLLLLIRTPTREEAPNVRIYHSGHYQRMGLNVQAMVDANLRFMYLAVLAGGRSSDVQAYRKSKLKNWIESLPPWYFVAGDNAYVCTEHLLTPFCGSSRSLPEYDAYNFFLSQMRIRVEMAFGMLVTKWRILRASLEVPLAQSSQILIACGILHNWCINERVRHERMQHQEQDIQIQPTYRNGNTVLGFIPSDVDAAPSNGSILRMKLVDKIASLSLSRPEYNLMRNCFEASRNAMYIELQ
jgi:hypothetical protein